MIDKSLQGLKALPYAFPRTCACCGRVYQNAEAFLEQTRTLSNIKSSLKEAEDDEGHAVVEVFRNCVCGSTLMDEFESRRDDSPEGLLRREEYALAHSPAKDETD